MGFVTMPFPTLDFASALLHAQASRAKVVGFAKAGSDTVNGIKQAAEFGLVQGGIRMAGLLMQVTDVHALGLQAARGLPLSETFRWDMNDRTRAFAGRVAGATRGVMPNASQAANYAAVLHYLKAAKAIGPTEARSRAPPASR